MRRNNRLVIALSEAERKAIDDMAESEAMHPSTMARRVLLLVAAALKDGRRWQFESIDDNVAAAIGALDVWGAE